MTAVVLLTALTAVLGCSIRDTNVPTHPGNGGPQAEINGVLTANGDGSCVWLLTESGSRLALIWPEGYGALRGDPLRIHNEEGDVVAQVGDTVRGSGGEASNEEAVPEPCRTGNALVVTDLRAR